MPKSRIQIIYQSHLEYHLLALLAEHPEGLETQRAYKGMESRHVFPSSWYTDTDGGGLPEIKWENKIRWARNELQRLGCLASAAVKGLWKLSKQGHELANKPFYEYLEFKRHSVIYEERRVNLDDLLG